MQKSYECEIATHIGPKSCGAVSFFIISQAALSRCSIVVTVFHHPQVCFEALHDGQPLSMVSGKLERQPGKSLEWLLTGEEKVRLMSELNSTWNHSSLTRGDL